jgi:hypothetical protein
MSRDEMLLRHGFYCGMADRHLGTQYGIQWIGRAYELTEAKYLEMAQEIQGKLVAAGVIGVDEDPFVTAFSPKMDTR